jgi:cytochrome c biogenesis protein ResB
VATALLALIGIWVALASALGVRSAFAGPVPLAAVALLALSTAVCAWQRTRVALRRTRLLREAGRRPWTVWGSPIFHWALVALIAVVTLGWLMRSSGQMGVAVGETRADVPASYGQLSAGPLARWSEGRSVRVDAFDVNYTAGGVDRGPTPTVSVLASDGTVIASQRVYPNHILKTGSLAIYPADYGLAAELSVLTSAGVELRRVTELLDFSGRAEGGTVPVAPLVIDSASGAQALTVAVTVPLDRVERGYLGRLPEAPQGRVTVSSADGEALLEQPVRPGESVELPSGELLRLDAVGYYARLQVVDDPTVPWLYAAAVIAMLGLGISTIARVMKGDAA